MTRNVSTSFRRSAEASFADEVDLCFLTISHPLLLEPIRVVWDTKDFVYGGETFTGFPFDIELLSDDEQPPTARLAIQNVDPRIGDTIRSLGTPARLKIELLSSADFNTAVDPRTEAGTGGDNLGVLLMHADGTDASTTFTDSSGQGHVITANGNAQIDTAQFKFGTASALFDGTGDYLSLDGSSDFAFGTGDFTVDAWIRLNVAGTDKNIFDATIFGGSGFYPNLYISSGNVLIYWTNAAARITGTTVLTTGTWYHIALTRSGTNTKIFLNGTQEGSTYVDSNNYINATSRPIIGANAVTLAGSFHNGWVDELRVVKGTAMWTANFTPPTAAYAAGVATVIYSADKLFLTNVTVDIMTISGTIQGWDYLQRVWPGQRATQASFPGLFR